MSRPHSRQGLPGLLYRMAATSVALSVAVLSAIGLSVMGVSVGVTAQTQPTPPQVFAVEQTQLDIAAPTLDLDLAKTPRYVPPGFESLLEPQTTLVDIYLGDRFVASQMATYTDDEITLSDPAALVEQIPSLLEPTLVELALSQPLVTHNELNCFYLGQQNCGVLVPETAGVIFNAESFRVDLFINQQLMAVSALRAQKFLPASDAEWSLLQTVNAAYSGSSGNTDTFAPLPVGTDTGTENQAYSFLSNSTVAWRENRVQLTGIYTDNNGTNIDTLVGRRDWQGLEYQLGYFRSNSGSLQFMSDAPVRGGRFASSLDTREDLRQSTGNELQIFLNSRSEVLLYKDDRLVSSRFYDAGNQVLDTSQLPGGAYDVRIEIREAGVGSREETRFYIKSSQLPPVDQALFFVEAGELLNTNNTNGLAAGNGIAVLRGGYLRRVSDQFGLQGGVNLIDEASSVELGLTHLGRYHDVNLSTFVGSNNRSGLAGNLRARLGGIYLNANYRKLENDNYFPEDEADLFGPSTTQASLGISTQLPFGRLDLSGRTNRRPGESVDTYSASFDFPQLRFGATELFFGVQASDEEGITTGLFTLEVRHSTRHFTGQLRPEYTRQQSAAGLSTESTQSTAVVSWQDGDLMEDKDLRIDLRGRQAELVESYGAELDLATQSGRLRLQAEHIDNNGATATRYNGNAFTSFMVNSQSRKLGGKEQSQSALLIEIDGTLTDAKFDILVDGTHRGTAYPGKTTALNLRPFETYSVQLAQRGSSFVDFEQQPRQVTLYPGNVVTLQWRAAELDVIFGRLQDQNGRPIENALINGVIGLATTDEFGLFQAEIRRDVKTLRVETRESRCEVEIPIYTVKQRIGSLGTLTCELQPKR